jgi:hypothetical protein
MAQGPGMTDARSNMQFPRRGNCMAYELALVALRTKMALAVVQPRLYPVQS